MNKFKNNCLNNTGIFYIINCFWTELNYNYSPTDYRFDEAPLEYFYKFGITSKDCVEKRFPFHSTLPYCFDVIYELKADPDYIYQLERKISKEVKQFKYKPKKVFNGKTECFLLKNISIESYLKTLNLPLEGFINE